MRCLPVHACSKHAPKKTRYPALGITIDTTPKSAAVAASDTAVSKHLTDRQLGVLALHHVVQSREITVAQTKYECAAAGR
jgi:hypothetical protein